MFSIFHNSNTNESNNYALIIHEEKIAQVIGRREFTNEWSFGAFFVHFQTR